MEEFVKDKFYQSAIPLTKEKQTQLSELLKKINGISLVEASEQGFKIEYNIYSCSDDEIVEILSENGFTEFSEKNPKQGFFKRLLKYISDSNKNSFGNKKLECCDLNQKKKH